MSCFSILLLFSLRLCCTLSSSCWSILCLFLCLSSSSPLICSISSSFCFLCVNCLTMILISMKSSLSLSGELFNLSVHFRGCILEDCFFASFEEYSLSVLRILILSFSDVGFSLFCRNLSLFSQVVLSLWLYGLLLFLGFCMAFLLTFWFTFWLLNDLVLTTFSLTFYWLCCYFEWVDFQGFILLLLVIALTDVCLLFWAYLDLIISILFVFSGKWQVHEVSVFWSLLMLAFFVYFHYLAEYSSLLFHFHHYCYSIFPLLCENVPSDICFSFVYFSNFLVLKSF